jgi:tetraacyldisaccharide 4'-kinase
VQLTSFFEAMYFAPKWYHYLLILLLFPLSLVYGVIMYIRRRFATRKAYDIPIISVGNLIVGGSGKTPFTIALASEFDNVTVISRGYGRKSKGLVEVSRRGNILTDVEQSGDEPMLMATSLPNASMIVSEDRDKAIELAQNNGAEVIILDDGFNRVEIDKFEILLEPEAIKNYLPFPAGPFREFWFAKRAADIVPKEGKEFVREVSVVDPRPKMLLVTAISNPGRLERYLPEGIVQKVYLPDHEYFDESKIKKWMEDCEAESILCTSKDRVKMEGFALPISEMKLKLNIEDDIIKKIQKYIQQSN